MSYSYPPPPSGAGYAPHAAAGAPPMVNGLPVVTRQPFTFPAQSNAVAASTSSSHSPYNAYPSPAQPTASSFPAPPAAYNPNPAPLPSAAAVGYRPPSAYPPTPGPPPFPGTPAPPASFAAANRPTSYAAPPSAAAAPSAQHPYPPAPTSNGVPPQSFQPAASSQHYAPAAAAGPAPSQHYPPPPSSSTPYSPYPPPPSNLPQPGQYAAQHLPPSAAPPALGSASSYPPKPAMPTMPSNAASSPYPPQPSYQSSPGFPGQPSPGYPSAGPAPVAIQRPVIPDYVVAVHPKYLSLTCTLFPNSGQLRLRSQIPFGGVLRPLADPPTGSPPPPVINPAAHGVIRCNECRTYVNPFVDWLESGTRWRCNMCHVVNEIPPAYYSPLDGQGRRVDVLQRPELFHGVVDIIAPADYMVRQPMPPTFFFVIDVSFAAVQSGVLTTIADTIRSCLDTLPGDKRTLVGFLTFDSALHFYTLKGAAAASSESKGSGVGMWVCSDLEDVFLPQPADLLVNLDECRAQVESFLSSLPTMFSSTRDVESCFGSALDAAQQVVSRIGGRMLAFLSCLPSLGPGRLVNREQSRLLGSDKENTLLQAGPGMDYYKKRAVAFTKYQICCDVFVFSEHYMDIATLADLSKLTGGQLFYYPGYSNSNRQHPHKLRKELSRCLSRTQGWEAVIRIRATKGVQVTDFHGNFYLRGSDLLALPGVDSEKAFTFELRNDDQVMQDRAVCVQTALLYTTSSGERRIRVLTVCLPASSNLLELYERANTNAMINVMVKHAIRTVYVENLDKAREGLRNRTVVLLRTYRSLLAKLPPPVQQSQELLLLPLMTLGAVKSLGLKEGNDLRSDVRAYILSLMYAMGIVELETFIRPRMLPIHAMQGNEGLPTPTAASSTDEAVVAIQLPPEAALTAESLQPNAAYLLDNGLEFLIRVGRQCDPGFLHATFGQYSLQGVDSKQLSVRDDDSGNPADALHRVRNVLSYLRAVSSHYQCVFVVQEGEPAEMRFFNLLIEDRNQSAMALSEFEQFIHRQQY